MKIWTKKMIRKGPKKHSIPDRFLTPAFTESLNDMIKTFGLTEADAKIIWRWANYWLKDGEDDDDICCNIRGEVERSTTLIACWKLIKVLGVKIPNI